jgi:hypothetical protein
MEKDIEELLKKALEFNNQVNNQDNLRKQRVELEQTIEKRLIKGEKLNNPILDYCLRNFAGNCTNTNGELVYTAAFDYIEYVKNFVSTVNNSKGSKIIEFYGDMPMQAGEISAICHFERKNPYNHRNLIVPVKELYEFDHANNQWKGKKLGKFFINDNIFRYPSEFQFNDLHSWRTDYSKTMFFGQRPQDTKISIAKDLSPLLKNIKLEEKNLFNITLPPV